MSLHPIFEKTFAYIYPSYVQKVTRKGRTETELLQVMEWLLSYDSAAIWKCIDENWTLKKFIDHASFAQNADNIKGSICGIKIQEIEEPYMKRLRYLDKVVDELAKGKSVDKIINI